MIVTLKDGKELSFVSPTSILAVAEEISTSLAKEAIAGKVNGVLKDVNYVLQDDARLEIITKKDKEIYLDILRHDTAHLLAQAVRGLFPETKIAIGPTIENGFYYDFLPKKNFTAEDLQAIEKQMLKLIDENHEIKREVWNKTKALEFFQKEGEDFKVEIIKDLPEDEEISVYTQGLFTDLCRGPHFSSTAKILKHFKLLKFSGAYWKGDSKREVLQRIYGTAFLTAKELEDYLFMLEEAEKRDHRKLGLQMDLFHTQEEAIGSVFWHPRGYKLYRKIENYIRKKLETRGYAEIKTPQLLNKILWDKSGHSEKFLDDMFIVGSEDEKNSQALKPMNCPAHVLLFKQGIKSYRDLPLRFAEFGACHRNEPSGALHGIMRVRGFTQDDAHIFCTEEQFGDEVKSFCELLQEVYKDFFGDNDIIVKFSDRPENRAGDEKTWDLAEKSLQKAAIAAGLDLVINKGEGAFYGPKLEFTLKDSIGRHWQLGTLQADFIMPKRLGAFYVDKDGEKKHPIMLHRAILGSLERFIGILIEHFGGNLPLWFAPTQVVLATITDNELGYAQEIYDSLREKKIDVVLDSRNEKISYKVREHSHKKVPVIMVVGPRDVANRTVALRFLGKTEQEIKSFEEAIDFIVDSIERKIIVCT